MPDPVSVTSTDRREATSNKDVDLLRRYQQAKASGSRGKEFTTDELKRLAQITGLVPSHSPSVMQKIVKGGKQVAELAPELIGGTLGGVATGGSPVGIAVGAGGARALTEAVKGTDFQDAAEQTMLSATGAGILPGVGRIMRNTGRAMFRSALPITQEAAEAAAGPGNRLATHRGVDVIVNDLLNERGMTPKKMFDNIETRLRGARRADTALIHDADRRGVRINPNRVGTDAYSRVDADVSGRYHSPGQRSGAESVVNEFMKDAGEHTITEPADFGRGFIGGTRTVPAGPMKPSELRSMQSHTPFQEEAAEAAGTKTGVTSLRRAGSQALKDAIPDLKAPMALESEAIPKLKLLDDLLVRPNEVGKTEVLVSGFKPSIFGMFSTSGPRVKFASGKTLDAIGNFLEGNNIPSRVIIPRGDPTAGADLLGILTEILASSEDE